MGFEILDHTADTGIRAFGSTTAELFENCALGMISLMINIPKGSSDKTREVAITIKGTDCTDLLYGFLSEVLYYFDGENFAPTEFKNSTFSENEFSTIAFGYEINPESAEYLHEIKAVTFHRMDVIQSQNQWTTQVFFDI